MNKNNPRKLFRHLFSILFCLISVTSQAASITEITSSTIVLIGTLNADGGVRVTMSDGSIHSFVPGNFTTNFVQALPVLQSNNNINVSISHLAIAEVANSSSLAPDQIGCNMYLLNFGMVFASKNCTDGILLTTPTQSVMATTALANGNHVSYNIYSQIPIYDADGNFIAIYFDTVASSLTLKD